MLKTHTRLNQANLEIIDRQRLPLNIFFAKLNKFVAAQSTDRDQLRHDEN